MHAATAWMSSYADLFCCAHKTFFLTVLHPLRLLQSFCLFLHGVPCALSWGIWPLELCILSDWGGVSVFVHIYHRRKRWWWLFKALLYECSRMLLRVHLLLCSFRRMVVFGFLLGPSPIWSWVLTNWSSIGGGFLVLEWALKPIRLCHSCISTSYRKVTTFVDWRICR